MAGAGIYPNPVPAVQVRIRLRAGSELQPGALVTLRVLEILMVCPELALPGDSDLDLSKPSTRCPGPDPTAGRVRAPARRPGHSAGPGDTDGLSRIGPPRGCRCWDHGSDCKAWFHRRRYRRCATAASVRWESIHRCDTSGRPPTGHPAGE